MKEEAAQSAFPSPLAIDEVQEAVGDQADRRHHQDESQVLADVITNPIYEHKKEADRYQWQETETQHVLHPDMMPSVPYHQADGRSTEAPLWMG